jgi:HTH-type transcriptional regulator / antitoxin HigA
MIKPIKNESDYRKALARMERIFDASPGTSEGDELEVLGILIEKYEDEHFPIDFPDPVEAIKFRMDQMGYKQKDIAEILGYKGRVSEILNRKRRLTLDMVRKLHEKMKIPLGSLIREQKFGNKTRKKKLTVSESAVAYKRKKAAHKRKIKPK